MATEAVKSTSITNADTNPPVINTAGLGGIARLRAVDGSVTGTTAVTSGSTYQLVRVRSNDIVKHLYVKLNAAVTTFTGDVGYYYSDAPLSGLIDGTLKANAGAKVNTGQEFGAAVAFASQATFLDLCNNVSAANLDKEAWAVAGLSSDPGGFFDIVVTTTATTSGAPVLYAEAQLASQ